MGKRWTSLPRHTEGYQHGVNSFLDFAFSKGRQQGQEILCPCSIRNNFSWGRRDEVYDHLISKEFQRSYTVWVHHGERITHVDSDSDEVEVHQGFVDDIDGLLFTPWVELSNPGCSVTKRSTSSGQTIRPLLKRARPNQQESPVKGPNRGTRPKSKDSPSL
ncbi:hypothetical protein AHAS_Ahas11G0216200 [Arachis hypogaea]